MSAEGERLSAQESGLGLRTEWKRQSQAGV